MSLSVAAAIALTLVCWASAFAGIRAALVEYSPFHLALARCLIASLLLAGVAAVRKVSIPRRGDWTLLSVSGLVGIAGYNSALNYGELTVTAGAASFIVNTVPIFTTLLSRLFLSERVPVSGWLGMGVSFCGVGLIVTGESGNLAFDAGSFAVLAAAICQALYFVLQKPLLKKYGVFEVVCYSIWTGTVAMFVFAPGLLWRVQSAGVSTNLAVLYLGVFPSTLANFSWSYVLSKMPASIASSFLYLVPAIAIGVGLLWLNEVPSTLSLTGGCIALTGVVLVNSARKRQPPSNGDRAPIKEITRRARNSVGPPWCR